MKYINIHIDRNLDIWILMEYVYPDVEKFGYPMYGYLDFDRNLDILNMDIMIFLRAGYPNFSKSGYLDLKSNPDIQIFKHLDFYVFQKFQIS